MKNTRVSDIMRRDVAFCSPSTSLEKVGNMMAEAECGFLPVVDGGRVVGVITDRDLGLALARRDQRASAVQAREAMSANVVACEVTEPVASALERMRERGVRRLPVLDPEQRLEGVLSLDDVALAARALEEQGLGTPLYPEIARTLQGICLAQVAPVRVAL